MPCVRFLVSGKVQGVFFRASTRTQALALKLTGYANNLADGRVEVFACGDEAALAKLEEWLCLGPPLARVDGVQRIEVAESAAQSLDVSESSQCRDFVIGGR